MSDDAGVVPEKKYLSAKEILEAADIQIVEVAVPEWGGVVRLRPMSASEGLELGSSGGDKKHSAVKLCALCCVDEKGERLFTVDDVEKLMKKSLGAMMRIQKRALEINGLSDEKEPVKNV